MEGGGCNIIDNIDDMELTPSEEEYLDEGQLVRVSGEGGGIRWGSGRGMVEVGQGNVLDNNIDDMELTLVRVRGGGLLIS